LNGRHIPVLVEECLRYLEPERGGLFVDATVGLGGHAEALLRRSERARLIGIDRDPEALASARERLAPFGERALLVEGEFSEVAALCGEQGVAPGSVAGILADLGVSSLQLDQADRGFSFRFEGPLDMRMGRRGGLTAATVVNEYPEEELVRIFRDYGEERQARRVARAIVRVRAEAPLVTTSDLKSLINRVKDLGAPGAREGRVDPATRVFQALRIEVNQELAELDRFLEQTTDMLSGDGRLVVISYHSLEDRRVKNSLRDLARGVVDPITGRTRAETQALELLTKKPVRPSEAEVFANPRSRSALLRAARRLEAGRGEIGP
jgi:16S rRNA (cytosine1402-N4)-methyltransferase